jgi:hypothetical protein
MNVCGSMAVIVVVVIAMMVIVDCRRYDLLRSCMAMLMRGCMRRHLRLCGQWRQEERTGYQGRKNASHSASDVPNCSQADTLSWLS